ncbi:MAG: hypothetical protein AB8H79_14540 [Myxococcota bacterium]
MRTLFFTLPLACLMGCSLFEGPPATELEGVYTIDSWTPLEPECDRGPINNILFSHFGVVSANNLLQGPHLFAYPCADVEGCAAGQDFSSVPGLVQFSSTTPDGDDDSGWTGSTDVELIDQENPGQCLVSRISWLLEPDGPDGVIRTTTFVRGVVTDAADCELVSIDDVPVADRCTETAVLTATFDQVMPPVPED